MRGKLPSYGRRDKMAQRVGELQWMRDQGWAVRGCSEQMVMGTGEGVGWPSMPGSLVSSNQLKGERKKAMQEAAIS